MSQEQIIQCFKAFNANSFNSLIYAIESNLWLILSVIGSLSIIVMNIKEEIEDYVTEEQTVL